MWTPTLENHKAIPSQHRPARLMPLEPVHEIYNNVVCATSKALDQPARIYIYTMIVKLPTEHHLEFLCLKGGRQCVVFLVKTLHHLLSTGSTQEDHFVGPTLCPICLQRLSADDTGIGYGLSGFSEDSFEPCEKL